VVIDEVLRRGGDSGGKPRLAQATVLFADLVGFTAFCERSQPEDVGELQLRGLQQKITAYRVTEG